MTLIHKRLLVAGASLLVAGLVASAAAAFSERGKVLLSEDFSGPALDKSWGAGPGKWEIVDGAAKASERPEDKHAAVRRHPLQYHDAIFEFEFQFNGARMINLSLNNKNGHVCRLIVTPQGMTLQTDAPKAGSDIKPAKLATLAVPVEPGKWHTAILEVHGSQMIAQLDGGKIISGESQLVNVDKADLGFPVAGVSALIRNVRVYALK